MASLTTIWCKSLCSRSMGWCLGCPSYSIGSLSDCVGDLPSLELLLLTFGVILSEHFSLTNCWHRLGWRFVSLSDRIGKPFESVGQSSRTV